MEEFILKDAVFIELNKLLKMLGLCDTGGAAGREIAAGQVRVDGVVELRKRRKIRQGEVVRYGGVDIVVAAAGEGPATVAHRPE